MFRIYCREFGHIFRDRQVMLILVTTLVFYSFFYPLPYDNEVVRHVPITVVDLDNTSLSRNLVRMVDATESVAVAFRDTDFSGARTHVYSGDAKGVLVIPKDFQREILRGNRATVSLQADAESFTVYKQVFTGIYSAAKTLSAGIEIKRLRASGMVPDQAMALFSPFKLNQVPLFNPGGGYAAYVVPMVFVILLQQLFFMGITMLISTMRETGNRGYFTGEGDHPLALTFAKGMAHFTLYAAHSFYCFGIMTRFYQFSHRGQALDMAIFMVPFLFAVVFGGFFMASFFKHREVPVLVIAFTSLPMIFLSRLSWPAEMIPDALEFLARIIPSTSGMNGAVRIFIMGADLMDVRTDFWVLCGLALAFFFLAAYRFWRLGGRYPEALLMDE